MKKYNTVKELNSEVHKVQTEKVRLVTYNEDGRKIQDVVEFAMKDVFIKSGKFAAYCRGYFERAVGVNCSIESISE